MIVHVILFEPKPDLTAEARRDLTASLSAAAAEIPSVRRFRVGRRITHGLPGYEQAMPESFEYAAIAEFDDLDGLRAYLQHPSHAAAGEHFTASAASARAYDYEMVEASGAASLAPVDAHER